MSFTEFIRIGESVYWLATPEQVDLAREALKEAQKTSAIIYRTPSDEHDPKVWTKGQRLIAKKTEEMSVPAEETLDHCGDQNELKTEPEPEPESSSPAA